MAKPRLPSMTSLTALITTSDEELPEREGRLMLKMGVTASTFTGSRYRSSLKPYNRTTESGNAASICPPRHTWLASARSETCMPIFLG